MDFREVCERALRAEGAFRAAWVRDAFRAVDRAHFVPRSVWAQRPGADGLHEVLDRDRDADAWYRAVWDPDRSVITQMDDHRLPEAPSRGDFTSSVSAPNVVCAKLCHLDLQPGHRVLELGTGSGYVTALLCERVGAENVTTVEVDPELHAWGTKNLAGAGYRPRTVCGDGMAGWPDAAPYDRVIATAALRHVPLVWLRQCAEDAVVLAPFGTCYARGALLRLRVRDGVASGPFVGTAHFMWMRGERPGRTLRPPETGRPAASEVAPDRVLDGPWAQDFALGLRLADVSHTHRGEGEERQVQFWDQKGTSVTVVSYGDWHEPGAVTSYGARDLWREVVTAYTDWQEAGQPDISRYGLAVDAGGRHQVWRETRTAAGAEAWPLRWRSSAGGG